MTERTAKVRLSAQVQQYIAGMEQAAKATREVGGEAEKLSRQGEAFERLGRASMLAGGAVVAGLTMATKAAIDWDSAWAGVTKTVDGSETEMAALESQLRMLTGILPASHAEIAAVAEAAGQLGIKRHNVAAFTRTMIDLGEATNLSAEEAAMSLARFVNIMGTPQDEVSRLGSALVGLGNNFATTESEILAMSMRLAKSGVQIGLSEGEVLGLATALSSVGIEAEAGGSAMSKVMIDIAASVDEGGDRLAMFATTAGMSADQFAKKWKTSPAEALAAFVKGLANAEAQGGSTLGVLAELGITEVRMRDALLGSAAAADQFAGAMEMGNEEFEANNALAAEAEKRYETTAAKLSVMGNKVTDAAISIGQQFLPMVEGGAQAVGNFADALSGLGGPMETVVAWGGLIVGTGLLGAGLWMAAVPKIAAYKAALVDLELAGGRLVRTMSAVGKIGGAVATWSLLLSLASNTKIETDKLTNAIERNAGSVEMLNAAADGYNNQGLLNGFGAVSIEADKVSHYLARARGEYADFWDYLDSRFGGNADQTGAVESLRVIGDELAALGATDLGRLQQNLMALSNEFNMSEDDMWTFIEGSDQLMEALKQQAGVLGVTEDRAGLLQIAYGRVGPAADDAGASAASAADDYMAQANAAKAAADELFGLIDALMEQNSISQGAEGANARYQQTLADVAEYVASAQAGVEGFSASLDQNSVEGSKNREMFAGLATDSQAAAKALLEQELATLNADEAAANYRDRLQAGRDALVEQIAALTGNREAAEQFADAVYKVPTEHEVKMYVETAAAEAQLAALTRKRWVEIGAIWTDSSGAERVDNWARIPNSANGNLFEFADGGGLETGIYRGGPPITRFAESETQWEAFISGKPSERDRNRQIWVDAGERLGIVQEIRAAMQGLTGARGGVQIGSVSFGSDGATRQQFRELEDTLDRISRMER